MSFRDAIKRTLQQAAEKHLVQQKSGLYVPPDYIAGQHFGGFEGYTPWIQDCIRAACVSARGIQPDVLSEITALVMWQAPPDPIPLTLNKHADVMLMLEQFAARVTGDRGGLTAEVTEQIRRVDGTRERGTLMVIALNPVEAETTGKLNASISAWHPASVEEAEAVPKRAYKLG